MTKTVNGKLDDIGEALAGLIAPDASGMPKIAVISDENTAGLYLDRCMASLERSAFSAFPIVVPSGEGSKNGVSFLRILEAMDFHDVCLSFKSSDPFETIEAYELAAKTFLYPLHLGVTEAGGLLNSAIKSSVALGKLLLEGIGDTIRISVSDEPI